MTMELIEKGCLPKIYSPSRARPISFFFFLQVDIYFVYWPSDCVSLYIFLSFSLYQSVLLLPLRMDSLPPQLYYTLIAENYSTLISGYRSKPTMSNNICIYPVYINSRWDRGPDRVNQSPLLSLCFHICGKSSLLG